MSLSGGLWTAVSALNADEGALQVTANNVANANTPGYSRQLPLLVENPPEQVGNLIFGTGVTLEQVQSIRDGVLALRIQQQQQQSGKLDSFLNALQPTQQLFNEAQGAGLESALGAFFNSWQQLSTNPTDLPTRQQVIDAGQTLATAFNQAAASLAGQQSDLNQSVTQAVAQVNSLTSQIAALNVQIGSLPPNTSGANQLVDQRTALIGQLSQLIDVSNIATSDGSVTLTTTSGSALVVGGQSMALTTAMNSSTGMQDVFDAQGNDITTKIAAGQLGGLIQARDQTIPGLRSQLDALANGIVTAVNTQHAAGFTLSGAAGGNFFAPPPAGGVGAAAAMAVVITDPAQIAASSDGTAGSNGNAVALADLRAQNLVAGQPPDAYYANMVANLGSTIQNATAAQQATSQVLNQLQNQRGAVSGVSLDEEAANLMKYQRAYQAAARVVTVIDQMTQWAVNLGQD